jgi:hypothetical protein
MATSAAYNLVLPMYAVKTCSKQDWRGILQMLKPPSQHYREVVKSSIIKFVALQSYSYRACLCPTTIILAANRGGP